MRLTYSTVRRICVLSALVCGVTTSTVYAEQKNGERDAIRSLAYNVDMGAVGLLANGTVSEAVAKLPAVAYDRSFLGHSATFLMIRGMNDSANRVQVNGTSLADPRHDRQDFSDMFFTKMFDTVTLQNIFEASGTVDVAGGIIQLSMDPKKAEKKFVADLEGLRQYDRTFPLFLLSYGGSVGSTYEHVLRYGMRKLHGPSYGNGFGAWIDSDAGPYPSSWAMDRKEYKNDLSNVAYGAVWHPSHHVEFSGTVLYAREDESNDEQLLNVSGYQVSDLSNQTLSVTANISDVDMNTQDASNWHDHVVSSLHMHTDLKDWGVDMAWAFDKATRHLVLDAMLFEPAAESDVPTFMTMDWSDAKRPSITWGDTVFASINDPQNFDLDYKRSTSYPRFDKQAVWKLDAARELLVYGRPTQLTAGTSVTSRVKKFTQERKYYSNGSKTAADFAPGSVQWPETFNNTQFPLMPSVSAVAAGFDASMDSTITNTREYYDNEAKERVASFYLQEEMTNNKLLMRSGLRYERTDYDVTGIEGDDGTNSWGGCDSTDTDPCVYKHYNKHETLWSPSLLLDYTVSKAAHVMSSFSKTYYKPRHIDAMLRASDGNRSSYWGVNPDLTSPISFNFDAGYRYQVENNTHREISLFAKSIKGLVVPEYVKVGDDWVPSLTNDNDVLRVYGVVLDARQPLAPILESMKLKTGSLSSRLDNLYLKGNLQALNNPTLTYDYPNSQQSVSGIPPEQFVSFTNNITLGYEDEKFVVEITRHTQSSYQPFYTYSDSDPDSNVVDPAYNLVDGFSQWSALAKAKINDKLSGVFEWIQMPPAYTYQGDSAYLRNYDQFTDANGKPQNVVALGVSLSL